ncbi:spermatogenesis-associated protein 1 isoform X2 [Notolabrus celidotus]|uniref:spermatogenesis-associated protein 1 isoform X2 n=1 Tax=Notolabrus celidotus TaxID=1203425 RepID=UPI00148FF9A4|nr:spermatogenesis-associated protein 1 isoform X2 [Notolabrus celidotus]
MELSCESVRYTENRRPASCKFVELHVLYVPDDQWNVKLNKVPVEAIENFVSAGFIRVYPDITLKSLRSELGALLGTERSIDKFSFLKCVGRSLALVKSRQERDLKVKTFAPPYAPQPELYLLPTEELDSSVCSQSLSPDTSISSQDHHIYYHPHKTCSLPTGTKEPVKFPLIPKCSHQPPPTSSLEEEEEEEGEDDDEQSYSSSESERDNEEEGLSSDKLSWAEKGCCQTKPQTHRAPKSVSENKGKIKDSAPVKESQEKDNCTKKKIQHIRQNRTARDSGVAPSLDDGDSVFSLTDGLRKSKDAYGLKSIMTQSVTESPAVLSRPVRCTSPPPDLNMAKVTQKKSTSLIYPTNREELIDEIKLVREERKQLEWTRQELLRKGKDLLAQNRHRRNQARDSWKKKYFETKKATAPLEESLRNLRQELETFYNKLLHQLQARDSRAKPRRQGKPSIRNELIIQIMTESYEIDNLKRKAEDAKMKLVTEIKLRKQAATELRALKAELAQKKSQSSNPAHTACLSLGGTRQDRQQVQNTSI